MKKIISVIAALLVILSIPITAGAATGDSYVIDESCRIVIGKNCRANESFAASTLSKYIGDVCGITPSIVTDDNEAAGYEIAVGETNRFSYTFTSALDGSYVIKKTETGMAIYGYGNRGTIYGVYGFLEKYCGLRIFTSTLKVLPENDKLEIPNDIDLSYNSYFEYTDTDWVSPRDIEYSLANGLSGGVYRTIPEEQGGTVSYIGQFCHTLTTVYCAADTYFDEHPEYFALHGGKRTGDQLCLTNEDTYNIVLSEVLLAIKGQHNPAADLQILSLTQHDNQNYCECDNCKAIDDANGSHAGTMITFVNKIAKAVEEAGYDNIAIDTFAYQYTRKTPTKVVPLDNVIVRLCTIECCFSHSLDDASCEENTSLMADLKAWSEICDRLYIWDYATNYSRTIGIFPDFGVIQKNAQVFYNNGVRGVYEEGNYYMEYCDTEFGELRAYLLSKLMQNPFCDYEAETNAFLQAYYGNGWENIRDFLNKTSESSAKLHLFIYNSMTKTMPLTDEEIEYCDTCWDNAIAACDDEVQLANIKRSLLSWRFWKACNESSEFSGVFNRTKENEKLHNDLVASDVTMYRESGLLARGNFLLFMANADKWGAAKTDEGVPYQFLFNPLAWMLFFIAIAVLLVVFIFAIIRKKYIFLIPLPLTCVMLEVALWNRRAFLAWVDIDEFVITLVLLSLYFGVMFMFMSRVKNYKQSRKSLVLSLIIGVLVYIVPHEAILIIINNVLNDGRANEPALSIALAVEGLIIVVVSVIMLVKLIKTKKEEKAE